MKRENWQLLIICVLIGWLTINTYMDCRHLGITEKNTEAVGGIIDLVESLHLRTKHIAPRPDLDVRIDP